MSIGIKTSKGDTDASINPFDNWKIRIDDMEMELSEFTSMARHFLGGGIGGWGGLTPEPVQEVLESLFTLYRRNSNGYWERMM